MDGSWPDDRVIKHHHPSFLPSSVWTVPLTQSRKLFLSFLGSGPSTEIPRLLKELPKPQVPESSSPVSLRKTPST
jgi:hypothetical protein